MSAGKPAERDLLYLFIYFGLGLTETGAVDPP